MPSDTQTEVVRASEIQEKVVSRLRDIRSPEVKQDYRKALKQYERRLGKRKEQTFTETAMFSKRTFQGFQVEHMGQTLTFERPAAPAAHAWSRSGYSRSSIGGDYHSFRAQEYGLLAEGGKYNRPMREARVEEYAKEMEAGRWRDLLSDPIAITEDGYVLNGQHRIAAVCKIDWSDDPDYDPAFLVIWNVDPAEALYADGSRRPDKDEKTIASKLVAERAA